MPCKCAAGLLAVLRFRREISFQKSGLFLFGAVAGRLSLSLLFEPLFDSLDLLVQRFLTSTNYFAEKPSH